MAEKSKRGFASPNFDPKVAKAIRSKGGKASKGGGRKYHKSYKPKDA